MDLFNWIEIREILTPPLWRDLVKILIFEKIQWAPSEVVEVKLHFFELVDSKEKDEACLGFLVKIFTRSVHREGVTNMAVRVVEFSNRGYKIRKIFA